MTGEQTPYRIRFERGESGLRAIAAGAAVIVIVDVLSFSTAVDVAVAAGASVRAMRPDDDIVGEAERIGAFRAVARNECSPAFPYSLSPDTLAGLPPGSRLILPSPNGATLIAAAEHLGAEVIITGCLRNASAIGAFINARGSGETVAIVAAGERWPDGSLRPALEDDLGAGAILACLDQRQASPEARLATHAFVNGHAQVREYVRTGASGIELTERGYTRDVDRALEVDTSMTVPILGADRFLSDHAR
jgi:2-phosphosulfolactate phosphatase